MKNFLVLLALSLQAAVFILPAQASENYEGVCTVQSKKYPDLTVGVNRDAICRETVSALLGGYYPMPEGSKLEIFAADQAMYSVRLAIRWTVNGVEKRNGWGTLVWYPGDQYVTLDR